MVYRRANRKKFARSNVGYPIGSRTTKVYQVANLKSTGGTNPDLLQRTVYIHELTALPQSTTNVVNQRQRNVVNCRGFRIWLTLRNNTVSPLFFNYAIVAPRLGSEKLTESSVSTDWQNNFFSDQSRVDKTKGFTNALTPTEFHYSPLNTQRIVVLRHKRFLLGQSFTTESTIPYFPNANSLKVIGKFYKLKRQIRYTGGQNTDCENRIYLIYWFDDTKNFTGEEPGSTGKIFRDLQIQYYFREPSS